MPRSATPAMLHCREGLNIKSITHLYKECHSISHATSRLKGDARVNAALDSKAEHEQSWTRKQSITCYSEQQLVRAGGADMDNPTTANLEKTKRTIKKNISDDFASLWVQRIQPLVVQGRFLELLHIQETHITWRSIIYNLPRGILQFAVNASIDTLATNANLKRWGKRSNARCDLCKERQTLHHVLNWCQPMLERYLWRHNSVLQEIADTLKPGDPEFQTFVDLPNLHRGVSTIPADIVPTAQRPDLVYVNYARKLLIIFELSVCFELNIDSTHNRKVTRYTSLVSDIEAEGFKVEYYPVEICSRGYISSDNITRLKKMCKTLKSGSKIGQLKMALCRIALLASYIVYSSKADSNWLEPPYIKL